MINDYSREAKPYLGGALKTDMMFGDKGTWGQVLWDVLIKDFNIKSVADIGCGFGYSTLYFHKRGLDAIGIEGGPNTIKNAVYDNIIQNDYTKSSILESDVDLIWCCEFVEHVEEQYSHFFLEDFKKGKYIAMTFADIDQEGYHHVNCQHQEYWIEKIEALGYTFDNQYTEKLRIIAIKHDSDPIFIYGGHLKRILFFKKI